MDTGAMGFSQELPFGLLKKITNGFSNMRIIEEARLGTFFQGIMEDGEVVVVKILAKDPRYKPDEEFNNEIRNIMGLKHENIVKLVGYCSETQGTSSGTNTAQYLICYEYLPMRSLEWNLFGLENIDKPTSIDWGTRFKIIQGICQGLLFLHKLDSPIVHMDLKPGNIWLDINSVPKIVNFGVSKLLGKGQTIMHTELLISTKGYMAPEYCHNGEFSRLSDIYSLGILIIEITTGEKNCRHENDLSGRRYIAKICETWTERHLVLKYSWLDSEGLQQVKACLDIGLECVKIDPKERPSLHNIVQRLVQGRGP